MIVLLLAVIAALSYFLGSVSGTQLVAQYALHRAPRRKNGTVSYAVMSRNFGAKWAWASAGVDVVLAVVAAVAGGLLMRIPGSGYPVIGTLFAGFCLVLGDIYPIQRGFRGGKGVLCLMTALWIADWRIGIVSCGVLGAVLAMSQYMSLASLAACFTGAIGAWIFVDTEQMKGLAGLLVLFSFVVVAWRHRSNISRLLARKEPKFSWGRQADSRLREEEF